MKKQYLIPLLLMTILVLLPTCSQPLNPGDYTGPKVNVLFQVLLGSEEQLTSGTGRWNLQVPAMTLSFPPIDHCSVILTNEANPANVVSFGFSGPSSFTPQVLDVGNWNVDITVFNAYNEIIGYRNYTELLNTDNITLECYGSYGQIPGTPGQGDVIININRGTIPVTPAEVVGQLARINPATGDVVSTIVLDNTNPYFSYSDPIFRYAPPVMDSGNYRLSLYMMESGKISGAVLAANIRVYDQGSVTYDFEADPSDELPALSDPTVTGFTLEHNGIVCKWSDTNFIEEAFTIEIFENNTSVYINNAVSASTDTYILNDDIPGFQLHLGSEYKFRIKATHSDFADSSFSLFSTNVTLDCAWVHSQDGDDSTGSAYSDRPFKTLDAAYSALDTALLTVGTIYMAEGDYPVSSGFIVSRNYTIRGSYPRDNWSGSQNVNTTPTRILPPASGTSPQVTLTMTAGDLYSLRIEGGGNSYSDTAGLYINGTSGDIKDCFIYGGMGTSSSIGLGVDNMISSPSVEDCDIYGGPSAVSTGVVIYNGNPDFTDTDATDGLHIISGGNTSGISRGVYLDTAGNNSSAFFNFMNIRGGVSTAGDSFGVHIAPTSTLNSSAFSDCEISAGNGLNSYGFKLEDGGTFSDIYRGTISSGNASPTSGVSAGIYMESSGILTNTINDILSIESGDAGTASYGVYINALDFTGSINGVFGASPRVGTIKAGNITGSSGGASYGIMITCSNVNSAKINNLESVSGGDIPGALSGSASYGIYLKGALEWAAINNIGSFDSNSVSGGVHAGMGESSYGLYLDDIASSHPTFTIEINKVAIFGGRGESSSGIDVNGLDRALVIEKSIIHGSELNASTVISSEGVTIESTTGASSFGVRCANTFINGGQGSSESRGFTTGGSTFFDWGVSLEHNTILARTCAVEAKGTANSSASKLYNNYFQNNDFSVPTVHVSASNFDPAYMTNNSFFNNNSFPGRPVLQFESSIYSKVFDNYSVSTYFERQNYHFPVLLNPETGFPSGTIPRIIARGGVYTGVSNDILGNSRYSSKPSMGAYTLNDPGSILTVNSSSGDAGLGNQGTETDYYSILTLSEALELVNLPESYNVAFYTEIAFDRDMTITPSAPYYLGAAVDINKSNPCSIILDGTVLAGSERILTIGNGDNSFDAPNYLDDFNWSTINGIQFRNSSALGGGALKISEDNLKFTNCSFVNNATSTRGGAIHYSGLTNYPGHIKFEKSTFTGNHVTSPNNTDQDGGGAVYLSNMGLAEFVECTFNGNYVLNPVDRTDGGGAVLLDNVDSYSFEDSLFDSNYTESGLGSSGALFFYENTGQALIPGSDNLITNCIFVNNTAGNGGAIAFRSGSISSPHYALINSCFFENNRTSGGTDYGGAINVGLSQSASSTSLNVFNSVFYENKANNGRGSALCMTGSSDTVNMAFNTFVSNSQRQISVLDGSLDFSDSIIAGTGSLISTDFSFDCEFAASSGITVNNIYYDTNYSINAPGTIGFDIFNIDFLPLFVNSLSPKGVDGVWGGLDDGFRIPITTAGDNLGTFNNQVPKDIISVTRSDPPDPGAYEYN